MFVMKVLNILVYLKWILHLPGSLIRLLDPYPSFCNVTVPYIKDATEAICIVLYLL